MKTAILQMADAGPVESTTLMLKSVGYSVYLPDDRLQAVLRNIGCDTVLSPEGLTAGWGYDPLVMPEVGPEAMEDCDLYCDVKAHRAYDRIVHNWPRLKDRILWTRINGGKMERVPGCGDEVTPPCPVLTPNLWYGTPGPWLEKSYACWAPFYRFDEYYPVNGRPQIDEAPLCLIHNIQGWGYGDLIDRVRRLWVHCKGVGSPDGLIQHRTVPLRLSKCKCMVHLKSSDAPGYALYEALAAACPVVCSRRLIRRNRMEELFIPGETCLVFDTWEDDRLDVDKCEEEIKEALDRLTDPEENQRIGMAGREKLRSLMWSESNPQDVESLREFMTRMFP